MIIFGGVKCIVKLVEFIVVVLVVLYIGVVFFVIFINIMQLLDVIVFIVKNVFGFDQVVGGVLGVVLMQGVRCGIFLNEVGMGSVLNVVVIVMISYFVKQGLI